MKYKNTSSQYVVIPNFGEVKPGDTATLPDTFEIFSPYLERVEATKEAKPLPNSQDK